MHQLFNRPPTVVLLVSLALLTFVVSAQESPSNSTSPSSTRSPSPTQSPSNSMSPSSTRSPSPTQSPSNSVSPSSTRSPTQSPTQSPSNSVSPSSTRSPSPTQSPSNSMSPSSTQSPTQSPSNSVSPSSTRSPTQSPTQSPSNSVSPSSTRSPTQSPTQSPSMSPSPTPSVTASTPSWACPAGWFMANPIGANAARCYRRFNIYSGGNYIGGEQYQFRSGSYADSCTSNSARLATFSSYSEYDTIFQACADQADTSNVATYYSPGCWLDGVTASPTTSRLDWDWDTPDIPDTNDFLVGSERDNLWGENEPTGYWWANNALPEQCMQMLINGQLNDYPCFGGLAAVCMKNATLA